MTHDPAGEDTGKPLCGAPATLVESVDRALGPPVDLDELLDEKGAGKVLRKPSATLRDWRYRGIGPPYVRVGPKSIRYRRRALEAWLDTNTVRPGGA